MSNTDAANAARTAANGLEAVAEAMDVVPDIWVGTVEDVQLPVGTKMAGLFKTMARVSNTIADMANTTAGLDLTEGGWVRRQQDWTQRVAVLDIQIEQVELQILGAERRRHQSLRKLNIQQRQIEQATEVLDLLRDKFTNHATYLFLQKYVADLYYQTYDLALRQARQAEHAFNFERGYTARKFIRCDYWDNLHEGLLAGERLGLDLARMEKEYCDLNRREYELTKHISMRLFFPREFLQLKVTGRCEIETARMDVRPRLARSVHAPNQERDVDDSVRVGPLQRGALPLDLAAERDPGRSAPEPAGGTLLRLLSLGKRIPGVPARPARRPGVWGHGGDRHVHRPERLRPF